MELLRLFEDESPDSQKAITLLREAGYALVTIPVAGYGGPELRAGGYTYDGLVAIGLFIKAGKCK